jgi:hypothetical protein
MTLRGPTTWVGGVLAAGHRGGWLVPILALVCAPIGAVLATWLGMQPIAPGTSVRVASIPSLLAALDDPSAQKKGCYRVASGWIGPRRGTSTPRGVVGAAFKSQHVV